MLITLGFDFKTTKKGCWLYISVMYYLITCYEVSLVIINHGDQIVTRIEVFDLI